MLFASRTEQAIFVGSADGRVEWANEAACRLCGSSRDELLGRKLRLFPDDPRAQSAAAQHVGARFAAGEVARLEASLGVRDGRTLWIELQVTPVPGASDGSSGWVAIARDVSERKQTEQALAESEERYRNLVEDSPEPAAVHAAGRLVYLNRAALALLGASSPEAVLGRSVFEFLHPDYHRLATERILKMEVVGDPAGPVVERLLRLDGSPVDVELAATPITWRGKPAIQLSGHALGRAAASSEETERGRAPALDLSSLVLRLAPRLEDRIAPRAVVSLDLSEARVALRGSSAALEELICSLADAGQRVPAAGPRWPAASQRDPPARGAGARGLRAPSRGGTGLLRGVRRLCGGGRARWRGARAALPSDLRAALPRPGPRTRGCARPRARTGRSAPRERRRRSSAPNHPRSPGREAAAPGLLPRGPASQPALSARPK